MDGRTRTPGGRGHTDSHFQSCEGKGALCSNILLLRVLHLVEVLLRHNTRIWLFPTRTNGPEMLQDHDLWPIDLRSIFLSWSSPDLRSLTGGLILIWSFAKLIEFLADQIWVWPLDKLAENFAARPLNPSVLRAILCICYIISFMGLQVGSCRSNFSSRFGQIALKSSKTLGSSFGNTQGMVKSSFLCAIWWMHVQCKVVW